MGVFKGNVEAMWCKSGGDGGLERCCGGYYVWPVGAVIGYGYFY